MTKLLTMFWLSVNRRTQWIGGVPEIRTERTEWRGGEPRGREIGLGLRVGREVVTG